MLRTSFWYSIGCGLLLLAWTPSEGTVSAAGPAASDGVVDAVGATFLIQGFEKPVRLRLTCLDGGKSWNERSDDAQALYLKALFSFLDSDGNGALSRDEIGQLPAMQSRHSSTVGGEVFVAFNYRVLDTDGDGSVGLQELESYLSLQGETSIRSSHLSAESNTDMLFRELDTDGDRVLSEMEASQADRLFELDRDGNQVIVLDELRGRSMGRLPPEFFAVVPGHLVPTGTLLIRQEEKSSDSLPTDAIIDVRVEFAADDAAPQATLTLNKQAEALGIQFEQSSNGDLVLKCGQRLLIFRTLIPTATKSTDTRQALEQEFAALSGEPGANASVSATSEMSPALKSVFLIADRNSDDQLGQTELQHYLDELAAVQSAANRGRLRAVIFSEQSGLLPLVDLNRDGRLSRREVRSVSNLMKQFGGHDRKLSSDDLPTTTLIVLQRGPFLQSDDKSVLSQRGPNWFIRADRNADGDLDRDEFPGSPEDFNQLDRNQDGWVDVDEALVAKVGAKEDAR